MHRNYLRENLGLAISVTLPSTSTLMDPIEKRSGGGP